MDSDRKEKQVMLPSYIIEKIIKREREKEQLEELNIECPEPAASDDYFDDDLMDEETTEDRGIVILDFTI